MCALLFVYVYVPETKGIVLDDADHDDEEEEEEEEGGVMIQ